MFTRRSFLTIIPAAAGTFSASSALANAKLPTKWDQTQDVVVVGSGAAGMFAAVAAKEAGAKNVLVIEKTGSSYLNSTAYSFGGANGSGTKAQKKQGIVDKDNLSNFKKEIIAGGKGTNREEIVKTYAEHAYQALDYLMDHGAELSVVNNASFPVKRMHVNKEGTGGYYVKILEKQAHKLGVQFAYNTKAVELLTNPEGNEVLGIVVENKGVKTAIRVSKGVVLASGGYVGSTQLIDQFLIPFKGALTCASPASEGQGLLMAMKIGAGTTHMDQGAVYAYGVPLDKEKRRGLIFRGHVMNLYGGITLGPDGKRFINDETNSADVSNVMIQKGFEKVYCIITESQLKDFMDHDPGQVIGWKRDVFLKELEDNKIFSFKADSIPDLAKKMGLPVDEVVKTVDRYNGFVKAGEDKDFQRKYMKGTFEKGPFYGFVCQPVAMASLGGLKANSKLQVLDVYNTPIKHLYAAGEILGGLHGSAYIGGDSVGSALTLGMIAGQNVVKDN